MLACSSSSSLAPGASAPASSRWLIFSPLHPPGLAQSPRYYARNIYLGIFSSVSLDYIRKLHQQESPVCLTIPINCFYILTRLKCASEKSGGKWGRADRFSDSSAGDSLKQTRQIKCDSLGQTCLQSQSWIVFHQLWFVSCCAKQNWFEGILPRKKSWRILHNSNILSIFLGLCIKVHVLD